MSDSKDDMLLPAGKTCGDCAHAHRCEIFGFTPSRAETMCSFGPSRFADSGRKRVAATPIETQEPPHAE